ncbi:MAG: hypothetical protein COB14_06435 [Alphaproteobacteria bacterium]|nr:MAG: hypothetical protein COB14_06435 [Alphaproteobacteria bacterium]
MDKEKQSPLAKAVFCAINGIGADVSDDMKYCVIINVGSVPLQKDDRAQVFVSNSQFQSTIRLSRFTESGLDDHSFAAVVADAIKPHILMGRVTDLSLFCEGCFSMRVDPEVLDDIDKHFPSERLMFMSFDQRIAMENVMQSYKQKSSVTDFSTERPYLDA